MTRDAGRRRSRFRDAHPLLNPFPVIVMSLAAFLVVFALLSARVVSSGGPLLGTQPNRSIAQQSAGGALRSRTSGGTISPGSAVSRPSAGQTAPLVTRTSVRGGGDDA